MSEIICMILPLKYRKRMGETQTIAGPVIVVPYTEEYYEREYTIDKQETEVKK